VFASRIILLTLPVTQASALGMALWYMVYKHMATWSAWARKEAEREGI